MEPLVQIATLGRVPKLPLIDEMTLMPTAGGGTEAMPAAPLFVLNRTAVKHGVPPD